MNFKLEDYEPVEARLARFWEDHPNGRIQTTLVNHANGEITFEAAVWRDAADPYAAANGHASETVGSSPVNRTSALENCETSAIGRALANLGYATKGKRPSREEMVKANRAEQRPAVDPKTSGELLDQLLAKLEQTSPDQLTSDAVKAELNAAATKMTPADLDMLRGAYTARIALTTTTSKEQQ